MAVIVSLAYAVIRFLLNRSPGVGYSAQQCASPSVDPFLLRPHALSKINAVTFDRFEHCRNRQRISNLWRSLYRVCSTLPAETSPDSWLDRRMAEHSWPSRGCIFHRIWVSEHDLGSCLDRKGLVPGIPSRSQGNLRFLFFHITGWRLHHFHRKNGWPVRWPYDLPWSPRQWNLNRSSSERSLSLIELSIHQIPRQVDQWFRLHQLGSNQP